MPESIKKLEKIGLSLSESLEIINNAQQKIESVLGVVGVKITSKFDAVITKNSGLSELYKISNILSGDRSINIQLLSPDDIACFKYAPITSCDVERSFSRLKMLLTDKRMSLLFENIKQYIIVQCNQI